MNQFSKALLYSVALLFASCATNEEDSSSLTAQGEVKVTCYIDAQPEVVVRTRATEDETLFRPGVSVLVFKGHPLTDESQLTQYVKSTITGIGNRRKLEVTLTAAVGPHTFVIVANAEEQMNAAGINLAPSSAYTYGQLQALITHTLVAPVTPGVVTPIKSQYLPMVGSYEVPSITATTLIGTLDVPLRLQRTVAKVSIHFDNAATGAFRLMGISAAGVPTTGNVLPSLTGQLSTPDQRASYFDGNNIPTTLSPTESNPVYLFESVNNAADESKHVSIVMKGKYNDKDSYYHIDLAQTPTADIGGTRLDLLRNRHYYIHMKSVEIMGYNSPAEALAQKPSNINYEITMDDETALDIVSNGQYALTFSDGVNFALEARKVNVPADPFSLGTIRSIAPGGGEGDDLKISYLSAKLKVVSPDFGLGTKSGELIVSVPNPTENVNSARITVLVGNLSKDITVNYQPVVIRYTGGSLPVGNIPPLGGTYALTCMSNVNDWYVVAVDTKTGNELARSDKARGASFWQPANQSVNLTIPAISAGTYDERTVIFKFYQDKYHGNKPFHTFDKVQDFLILQYLDLAMPTIRRLGDGYGYTQQRVLTEHSVTVKCNLPGVYLKATCEAIKKTVRSAASTEAGDRITLTRPLIFPENTGRKNLPWKVELKHERKNEVFATWDVQQTCVGLYIKTTLLNEVSNPDPLVNTKMARSTDGSGLLMVQEDMVTFHYVRFPGRALNPLGWNLYKEPTGIVANRDPCTMTSVPGEWYTPRTKGNTYYISHSDGFVWGVFNKEAQHYFGGRGWQDGKKGWMIRDTSNKKRSSLEYVIFGTTSSRVYGVLYGRDLWNSSYRRVVDEDWILDASNGAFYIRCQSDDK